MGNYRFKFSDMIPNAWFYKLRDMSKGRKQTATHSRKKKQCSTLPASASSSTTKTEQSSSKPKQPHQCIPRKSYYFTRDLNTSERIHNTSPEKNHNFIPETNFHPQQPRKSSSKQRPKRRTPRATTTTTTTSLPKLVTANCSCHNNNKTATFESMSTKSTSQPDYSSSSPLDSSAESEFPDPEFRTDRVLTTESFDNNYNNNNNTCCGCRVHSNTNDIIIDVDNNSIARKGNNNNNKENGYDNDDSSFSDLVLPPIVTKPAKFNELLSDAKRKESKPRNRTVASNEELNMKGSLKVKIVKEEDTTASVKEQRNITNRRYSVTSPGVRLRINSPRIGSRKVPAAHGRRSVSSVSRRSLSDSFAVVKSSLNPQRDFRESMVEMIVQNNIRTSKDLEDLLACYLSLNSDEYHELIINVFKQIWLDLTDITCRKNNLS